jgi:DNA-binding transcriptional regulator YiaG
MTSTQVKALRTALGLTQEEFASLIDVSVFTISKWESGKPNRPTPSKVFVKAMERIAEENGIDWSEIMKEEEK